MRNRIRITMNDIKRESFYQMPKFLFTGEFKDLNNDARVLYSLLKDRHEISTQNKWANENGEIYLIMTRDEMCELLGVTKKTAIKAINSLKELHLIEEERFGMGNPNKIYLLRPYNFQPSDSNPLVGNIAQNKSKISTHRSGKFTPHKGEYFHPNKTNSNKTDMNKTQSINPNDTIDTFVARNISLEQLLNKYPFKQQDIQELYRLIVEVLMSNRTSYRIAREDMDASVVKEAFFQLDSGHIEYVLESLGKNATEVTNINAYLLTALYNATKTINNHYSLMAQYDLRDFLKIF